MANLLVYPSEFFELLLKSGIIFDVVFPIISFLIIFYVYFNIYKVKINKFLKIPDIKIIIGIIVISIILIALTPTVVIPYAILSEGPYGYEIKDNKLIVRVYEFEPKEYVFNLSNIKISEIKVINFDVISGVNMPPLICGVLLLNENLTILVFYYSNESFNKIYLISDGNKTVGIYPFNSDIKN
jgi:hypothetical protein